MESEILEVLKEIRGILYVMAIIFTIGVAFWVFNSASLVFSVLKGALKKAWNEQANDLFNTAEYEKLILHCEKRYKTHNNDINAYWWHARACRELGETEKSNELFEKVSTIDPSWYKDYVLPYLNENEKTSNK